MSSLEPFILRIKPALDNFLRQPDKNNINNLKNELSRFNWTHMNIFNVQILVPLVLKLDELSNSNQDIRSVCLQCLTLVTSKVYLKELTALRTMLVVILKQIRECDKAAMKTNLSEELKLATVQSIDGCLRRTTTDVLEQFYCNESSIILGQILLTLVDIIENEKYKTLVLASFQCLLSVFYVHDEADRMDVVLRNQVANVLFIFLPKIVTVLYRTAMADDKIGESIKIVSIKALSRILCLIYEETTQDVIHVKYDEGAFKQLISTYNSEEAKSKLDNDILFLKKNDKQLESRMNRLQCDGRSKQWTEATSKKLRVIFSETIILRSHESTKIRQEYAEMCCLLIQYCAHSLKENYIYMLETVIALTEDEDEHIKKMCSQCLEQLQETYSNSSFFDENAETLLDVHLTKIPRIVQRCDAAEQYAEFIFIKGFFKSISCDKLRLLLSISHNLEMLCMCLLSALEFNLNINLLAEEYSLRDKDLENDFKEAKNLPWRSFKWISSDKCVKCLEDICTTLGRLPDVNKIIFNHLMEMLQQQSPVINEILLIMLWISTSKIKDTTFKYNDFQMVKKLLNELLEDKHWHLALLPDPVSRLKTSKPSDWFIDQTPGLYESSVEIRTQDCDSDDETEYMDRICHVTIADAQYNVFRTCLILDYLGHCAQYIGERFDGFIFQSLHKVLLKLAHSNSMVYKAANFALHSIQKALRIKTVSKLLENHADYISYHLNTLLKKVPECYSAMEILAVVLQYSTHKALPHLESIFHTIYEECYKAYQTKNIVFFLRVFNAFLNRMTSWVLNSELEIFQSNEMEIDETAKQFEEDLFKSWQIQIHQENTEHNSSDKRTGGIDLEISNENNKEENEILPRNMDMIKSILEQVMKFISSSDLQVQILSLECFTYGVPLLAKYENELLPLVHKLWSPLVEKFRQRNPLVLNRCFTVLAVLATNAKEFITKRSLDDIIPYLKEFLQKAAQHSNREQISVQTQEFKLQRKLLEEFPSLIKCLDIDGKHLNDIAEIISSYLCKEQQRKLQLLAISFFTELISFNGPIIYLVIVKKSHLKFYEENVRAVLLEFGIK